jgi:amino acid adenylation domain-containing protein
MKEQNAMCDDALNRGPHEFIEEQAAKTPGAPAVAMGANRLCFSELNLRANQLASFLREHQIGPGRVVGVYADRSVEMVVCLLAILKAGGVYLPLDPKFPKERLEFMLEDAEVSLVLTNVAEREDLPSTKAEVVLLQEMTDRFASYPGENLPSGNKPEDLAYILYTSGSTGKPKGVMIPRRALVNFLLSMAKTPGMTAGDSLLAVTTISFDISLLEMLLPLVTGASIVVAARDQASDPFALRKLLEENEITVMQATPTTWRLLVNSGWEGKHDLKILCGGEALTPDLAEKLIPRCRELWNMYGPTETTIWSSTVRVTSAQELSLGPPIANTQLFVVDEHLQLVEKGATGELLIGGDGLSSGYLKREELTAEKFIPNPFSNAKRDRLYRTGDEVRYRTDGTLEFLGRLDHQIKLNGFRIELGEIESVLAKIESILQAVVILRTDVPGDGRLVAYYTGDQNLSSDTILQKLRISLPEYMMPSAFVWMSEFPQTPNAKLDRKALPAPTSKRPLLAQQYIAPATRLEKQMAALWAEFLKIDQVGVDDSFFDLGGNSLAVIHMASAYRSRFGREIPLVKVFQYPTVAQLCRFLDSREEDSVAVQEAEKRVAKLRRDGSSDERERELIAIVGMVGRFPGAENLDQLWKNLCESRESISFFAPEEIGPGLDERLRTDPDYVRARGIIEGAEYFDAGFFGISPLEAKVMDPQQRVFLELAYHALENAGYDPARFKGLIGVYAGIGDNHYYTTNLLTHPDLLALAGRLAVEYGNEKDYIALRAAYLLDLRGPAISMNTACSTTLIAADHAYRALLDYECDMALAGGVDITVPQKSGFPYTEGGTFTRDGHCRPFDADATGTMFCDGAGIVVLKRLSDAIRDHDTIYALLLGSGKNNNGARPVSFLAPSIEGQEEAIALAQARANIDVETIGYIETHGTGTPVGDPIEFQALTRVFEKKTQKKNFCFIGSIKGNIGHSTNAAGVAGLIKAAMVLDREQIPATLHFKRPNPQIDFANSSFIMADRLVSYPRSATPRRTAVSSFGFGGTNAHVILEEAPKPRPGSASRPLQLLLLSARTAPVLEAYTGLYARHFETSRPDDFADTAFTLQTGRKRMTMRRFVVAKSPEEASELLRKPDPMRCASKRCQRRDPPVVFLFGGQGTQYVNMGLELYKDEPLFRAVVNDCCEILKPHLGRDLHELLYPKSGDHETAEISLKNTLYTQPSIFVIEYALARFWQSLGIQPALMAGHSIGEFVAATLADVWSLDDALRIVALRGKLMQSLPRGTMMAVRAAADRVTSLLPPSVSLAANNSPSLCVVSGPETDVDSLRVQLEADNIACRPLHTSHAFHSAMMEPMLDPLLAEVKKVKLRGPSLPFVSTVTGQPITEDEVTNPAYWARHARMTVQFSKAVMTLKEMGHDLFLECGPRSTMCALVRQHFNAAASCTAIPSFADTPEDNREWISVLSAIGSLWLNGATIDWDGFYANEDRRHIPLPNYPFERQKHWVDPATVNASASVTRPPASASLTAGGTEKEESEGAAPVPAAISGEARKDWITAKLLDLLVPISGRERSEISTSATFLEQGFDSLSLAQVSVAIEHEFGEKIGFNKLMNHMSTVEAVAAHLDAELPADSFAPPAQSPRPEVSQQAHSAPPATATEPHPDLIRLAETVQEHSRALVRISEALDKIGAWPESPGNHRLTEPANPSRPDSAPTTAPQKGIFFSSRLSDHLSSSYNESVTLQIQGTISVPKITRSLERLAERHDALRAYFDETGSEMTIRPSIELDVPVRNLPGAANEAETRQVLEHLAIEECARPFVLPGGPLFRGMIVLLDTENAAVVLTAHHIICDGWSVDILIQEFSALYSEELSGAPSLPKPQSNFVDYAAAAARREQRPEFAAAKEYWRQKFADGFPALVLPTDFPRNAVRDHSARRVDRVIGAALVDRLKEMAAKQRCGLFAVTVAALSILLARISRQRRFVLALSMAEQPVLGQVDLVGHCVSLMPFLVELHAGEDLRTFIVRVQRELANDIEHLSFTIVHLLEDLVSASPTRNSPVPAGLTSIRKFRPDELEQRGFALDYVANPNSFESFECYFAAMESNLGIELRSHFDTQLFKDTSIESWLADFESILIRMMSSPDQDVLELAQLESVPATGTDKAQFVLSSLRERTGSPSDSKQTAPVAAPVPLSAGDSASERQNSILTALVALWRSVLNRRSISADDNFFELGGHSINAAQLFALIERQLGIVAPLAALYQSPTPRQLASVLALGINRDQWRSLVPIQTAGDRPPLFLVHGAEGNVLLYRPLAAYLGKDQPLYGLQSAGLDGQSPINGNFEQVARQYVDEIRQVQKEGPYLLGGYCLGGTIAMEMARQLMEAGQQIGLLAMIEDFNICSIRWPLPWYVRTINRVLLNPFFHLQNIAAAEGNGKFRFFKEKFNVEMDRAQIEAHVLLARVRRALHLSQAEEYHHLRVADVYDAALAKYEIKPYPGEITLFMPKMGLMGMTDPMGGWKGVAQGGIRLYTLPFGPRGSLTEPYVRQLARLLRSCIDEVVQSQAGSIDSNLQVVSNPE